MTKLILNMIKMTQHNVTAPLRLDSEEVCLPLRTTTCILNSSTEHVLIETRFEDVRGVCILVPRANDPSGLRQESRALGATILK